MGRMTHRWLPPILWPMPTNGRGIWSRKRFIMYSRSLGWSCHESEITHHHSAQFDSLKEKESLTIVTKLIFVQNTTSSLRGHVCYPYTPNRHPTDFRLQVYLVPERLIQFLFRQTSLTTSRARNFYLRESIRMGPNYSDALHPGRIIVNGGILLDM